MKPVKSNCLNRKRTRTETTTLKRAVGLLPGDKESKLTTLRTNPKNDNHAQRDEGVECHL